MKGVTASLRNCGGIVRMKYQSNVVFRKQPFWNWAADHVNFLHKKPYIDFEKVAFTLWCKI